MSDASAGQIVGGVAGAVAGFIVGGGPVGAVRGFAIGYGLGGYVDPPDGPFISAPRLGDLTFQTSTYGAPIPQLYGTIAVSGNVIYLENNKYKEVATEEEQGGKGGGGGATVETVSYFATFAVALSEAAQGSKIRKIWLGGELFYNIEQSESGSSLDAGTVVQSAINAKGFKFYDGSQTEPDDRIESIVGADNAESYEGTAYIIFYDLPLKSYGNSLQGAPVKVELAEVGISEPALLSESSVPFVAPDDITPNTKITICTQSFKSLDYFAALSYGTSSGVGTLSHIGYANKRGNNWIVSEGEEPQLGDLDQPQGINDGGQIYNSSRQALNLSYQNCPGDVDFLASSGYQVRGRTKEDKGVWVAAGSLSTVQTSTTNGVAYSDTAICVAVDEGLQYVYLMTSSTIYKYNKDNMSIVWSLSHGLTGSAIVRSGASRMWHDEGVLWVGTAEGGTTYEAPSKFYSVNSAKTGLDYRFDLPREWGMARSTPNVFEFAVYDGMLFRGGPDGDQSGNIKSEQWQISGVPISRKPLSEVVTKIVGKSGIDSADIDTAQLSTELVDGYAVMPSDARGALSQLQAAYLFDVVSDGYGLRCVTRGANPVVVIPYGDLGAKKSGSGVVDRLTTSREMDSQLPSRVNINYLSANREYEQAVQYAESPTSSFNVKDINLAIVMSADKAARLADVIIRLSWISREVFTFRLPQKYMNLKVSDVVTVQTPQQSYQVRIESINQSNDQILTVSAKLSAPSLYNSSSLGSESPEPDPNIPFITDATGFLVDIPMIESSTDHSGFIAAMYGESGWTGGSLFRSIDGGQTYSNMKTWLASSSVAFAFNSLSSSDCFVIDRASRLLISVVSGDFSAISEQQMMAGSGWLAYGAEGRWELMRYSDSVLNADSTVTLSGLIRGARGTEWATGLHQDNDLILKLSTANNYFIGSDIGRLGIESDYKAVTIGQNVTNIEPFGFTYRGVNLRPLSPVLPVANKSTDWQISCTSRTRYQSSFWVSGSQPQNESALLYELDILDGQTVVRTINSSTPDFTYTESQQIEDFGVEQEEINANCYQVSDRVGRGLPLYFDFVGEGFLSPSNPDLLSFYTMSNVSGSTLIDESPNGNNGTLANSPAIVPGRFGGAMLFNGSNQYAEVNSELPTSVTEFSWSFWVELISGNGLVNYYGEVAGGDVALCTMNQSVLTAQSREQGGFLYNASSPSASGLHHVVMNYQKQGIMEVYLDGSLVSSVNTNITGSVQSTRNTIGAAFFAGTGYTLHFNGTVEQRRTFNRVLTQSEITILANEI